MEKDKITDLLSYLNVSQQLFAVVVGHARNVDPPPPAESQTHTVFHRITISRSVRRGD